MLTGDPKTLSCGLVMPISAIDGCTAEHWSEVKSIIIEAVESITDPIFSVRLVGDADDIGVIQKRIVQNLYSSDIIVCDVSGKNPNVMFELGMRLAFDKPTVIVKDEKPTTRLIQVLLSMCRIPEILDLLRSSLLRPHLLRKLRQLI
jgi:hypothetical protein